MIRQDTIDQVKAQMDTREVLESFGVEFKRDKARCPFHDENSASFHIWRRQNTYKCFGCGKSGDAISFLIDHENMLFHEAVEWLANRYNITVEIDHVAKQESQDKKDEKEEMGAVVRFAQKKYEDTLHGLPEESDAWKYLLQRDFTAEIAKRWSLGYAPDDWKFITSPLINMGKLTAANQIGLVWTKEGKNWDFFRSRIIIPIHNANGQLIGFGGRDVSGSDQAPKYLNPSESALYNKQATWFGLDKAIKAIKEDGFVYVVEGYFDVMSLHEAGLENTVAGCGTEVTEIQCKLLKRYTNQVTICFDNDKDKEESGKKNAGVEKMMKLVNVFLKLDFKVEVIEIPEGGDPDEYARSWKVDSMAFS